VKSAAVEHPAAALSGGPANVLGRRRGDTGTGLLSFCRFKEGLKGRVRLHREDLTGVLGPLLDTDFFGRVYIDSGAVAWPGDIDLAPDAMYAQVAHEHGERERAS
jgi:Protein of unknown function (DUF2442)